MPNTLNENQPPKLFISYSWTTLEHENWVLKLATDLVDSGVDVILDKWHLREGQEAYAFMEQMVSDPTVSKVAMICDKAYVKKANDRKGGVGSETQIITPEIMRSHQQTKYVAVVTEHDENGRPWVPTYFGSRIFIDFTEASDHATAFEKLVRWVFDKPVHVRPTIGRPPAFLAEVEGAIRLTTGPMQRRAIEALRNGRTHALPALKEYFDAFTSELEKFRIAHRQGDTDDLFMTSIESFLPYRNEMIDVFVTLSAYADTEDTREIVHNFFGGLIRYQDRIEGMNQHFEIDFDNFKFFIHELFLYCIASYLKNGRYDAFTFMVKNEYYCGNANYGNRDMIPFDVFRQYIKSFELRNKRLNLGRILLQADVMKERSKGGSIDFLQLMTADFMLFLRAAIDFKGDRRWYPVICIHLGHVYRPFEIFARAKSAAFFERIKPMFGATDVTDFRAEIARIEADRQTLPRWDYNTMEIASLIKPNEIATVP